MSLLVIPSRFLILGAALAGMAVGWTVQGWRWKASEADALAQMEEKRTEESKLATDTETELETIRKQNRGLTRRLAHETQNEAYRCPIPADGERLLNEARTGQPASEPAR